MAGDGRFFYPPNDPKPTKEAGARPTKERFANALAKGAWEESCAARFAGHGAVADGAGVAAALPV